MFWDVHIHTCFSSDGEERPEQMIEAGIQMGLKGICFTDHLDYDYPGGEFLLDLPAYFEKLTDVKNKYKQKFPICIGLELGLQPHLKNKLHDLLLNYPFDFVIGSSHLANGMDVYDSKYYENKEENEAYEEYFQSILENLSVFDEFDVYGHIDYVVRYGPNRNKHYTYQKYSDIIDEILKQLIERGKGIEVNTGGLKYGLGHPNPTEEIIHRYKEMGGEIITVGSDAHKSQYIGYEFDKIPNILKDAGFRYYTIFKNRKPEFIKL